MSKITRTLRNTINTLATEAKAEENKVIGRHRREMTAHQKIAHKAHRTAVHVFHTAQLAWLGMPAILVFEAARPAWAKYVETPIAELMFGNHGEAHTEAIATIASHFIG